MDRIKTFILFAFLIIIFIGCEKIEHAEQISEATPEVTLKTNGTTSFPLMADQFYNIGDVSVNYLDGSTIQVIFSVTDADWCLTKTHLDIQLDPLNFPTTGSGNPKVGHFEYGATLNCDLSWDQTVDLTTISGWEIGDVIYVAAHSDVMYLAAPPKKSAWAGDIPFGGNSWATYFGCDPPYLWQQCGDQILYEDQVYNTILIADKCWFKENLNVGTRIDGNLEQPDNGQIEKYCYNNDEANCDEYGGLYQWNEVMQHTTGDGAQGICPPDWHVSTYKEWDDLRIYGGGIRAAGGKLKETGFDHWFPPNVDATNEYGFTGLPGGYRSLTGGFKIMGYIGHFWTSTGSTPPTWPAGKAWRFRMYAVQATLFFDYDNIIYGHSVRCIKD